MNYTSFVAIAGLLSLTAACGSSPDPGEALEVDEAALAAGVVVNECKTGAGGWIELYNAGSSAVDLAKDLVRCYWVDDAAGGSAPTRITDANVIHPSGSTTCSSVGRPSTCARVGVRETVLVRFAGVDSSRTDACRLLTSTKSIGSTCSTTTTDGAVGGTTRSLRDGTCFGRVGDSGAWATAPIPCSELASNAFACPAGCNDFNSCTDDWCGASGCQHATLPDMALCGPSAACVAGSCRETTCDDGDPCTVDTLTSNGCTWAYVATGLRCTQNGKWGTCNAQHACVTP